MFLLCMICVVRFFLDKSVFATEEMPPKLLDMTLKHINTLLTDIGAKIVHERDLLYRMEPEKEKEVTRQSRLNSVPPDKEAARKLIQEWKISRIGGVVPELPKDPVNEFDSQFMNLSASTTTKGVNFEFNKTLSKQSMLIFMKKQNVSYCVGAVQKVLQVLYEKTEEELDVFLDAFTTALWGLADDGKLDCLGPLLRNRILRLSMWTKVIAPLYIQRFMRKVVVSLDKKYFVDKDAEKAILAYDSLFTDEEGDQLLNSVIIIEAYNITARGKDQTTKICEIFINNFIAPVNRLCNTFFLKNLINDINIAYSTQYPEGARSARKSIMDSLVESKSALQQSICKKYRHIRCDYRRSIQYLFVKFPSLFKELAEQYRNNKKIKHNRNERKPCSPQPGIKRSKHRNKIFEKIYNRIFPTNISKNKAKKYSQFNYSRQNTSFNTQNKMQTRFYDLRKRITVVNNSNQDISMSTFMKSGIKNDMGNYALRFEKSNVTYTVIQHFTQSPYSTEKGRKKTGLHKIVEESSYSDEEMYLRVMLKDALIHGNNSWSG